MNLCSCFAFRVNREPLCGDGDNLPSLNLHGKLYVYVTLCKYHTFVSQIIYKHSVNCVWFHLVIVILAAFFCY